MRILLLIGQLLQPFQDIRQLGLGMVRMHLVEIHECPVVLIRYGVLRQWSQVPVQPRTLVEDALQECVHQFRHQLRRRLPLRGVFLPPALEGLRCHHSLVQRLSRMNLNIQKMSEKGHGVGTPLSAVLHHKMLPEGVEPAQVLDQSRAHQLIETQDGPRIGLQPMLVQLGWETAEHATAPSSASLPAPSRPALHAESVSDVPGPRGS